MNREETFVMTLVLLAVLSILFYLIFGSLF